MDKCNKFKLFICLLILGSANIFLYRHFSQPMARFVTESFTKHSKMTRFDIRSTAIQDHTEMQEAFTNSQKHNTDSLNKSHTNEWQTAQPVLKTGFKLREKNLNSSSVPVPLTVTPEQKKIEGSLPTKSASVGARKNLTVGSVLLVSHNTSLNLCPMVPPGLNGQLATYLEAHSWEEIGNETPGLQPGGRYKPPNCQARHRVAIIIPYRNREEHLKILLQNLHPILSRQQLDYGIYVIHQALPGKFNRAMLMNIGYAEAMKKYDYQCAVFHDVDLVPENDRNIYSCPEMPRHMSAAIDKFRYRLPYAGIYGGVSAVSKEQFEKINGFSNMFFGWGGEDDDMAARFALLKTTAKRMAVDGLNSLVYEVQKVEELPTHTMIQVLIKEEDILKKNLLVG